MKNINYYYEKIIIKIYFYLKNIQIFSLIFYVLFKIKNLHIFRKKMSK